MSPEEHIARGDHAKRLLEDELFKSSLSEVKTAIMEQWASLPVENKAQCDELKRLLWAANQFEAVFTGLIAGATMSRQELLMRENMETKAEAAKGRLYA